jgi:hypothetical protein
MSTYNGKILRATSVRRTTAARSRQDSWASSAKKIRPLEKKLGRKPATPQITWKSAEKNCCYKFLGQFLPIIVKIRPLLGNLELGRFLGRWLPRPQEILLGHFWVQRPWIRPSGTSASDCSYIIWFGKAVGGKDDNHSLLWHLTTLNNEPPIQFM